MCAVPSTAVFYSESIECFPGTVSKFFFKLLVTIPVAPIITGTIVHFRFHIRCISIHKLLYFNFFTASFCTTFLSAGIATSISVHVFSFLFFISLLLLLLLIYYTLLQFSCHSVAVVLTLEDTKQYTTWIVPSPAPAEPLCIHHTFSQSAVDSNEDRWSERPLSSTCSRADINVTQCHWSSGFPRAEI